MLKSMSDESNEKAEQQIIRKSLDRHNSKSSSVDSAANRSASRSSSPEPPKELVWERPPSPFLGQIYQPSFSRLLTPPRNRRDQSKNHQKTQNFKSKLSAPFHQGLKAEKEKSRKFDLSKLRDRKLAHQKTRALERSGLGEDPDSKYAGKNFFDMIDKPILTNEVALKALSATTTSQFFDPEIDLLNRKTQSRGKRALKFVRPGTYEKRAHTLRAKMLTEDLQKGVLKDELEDAKNDEEFGYFCDHDRDEKSLDTKENKVEVKSDIDPKAEESQTGSEMFLKSIKAKTASEVEWWDKDVLKEEDYSLGENNFVREMITHFVQHPVSVAPPLNKKQVEPVPLFLTAREKKKARRMKKQAKLEIQAERVRLGLEEPPDPRVSLANIMRVLGNTAVQDPSAVERQVRAKVEKRRVTHLLHNELRKLTPAERRSKKKKKLAESLASGVSVAVFLLRSLSESKARFKVDVTASQHNLSGAAVICPLGAVVVVEGGPIGIRKFGRMVMERISWNETFFVEEGAEQLSSDEEELGASGRGLGGCVCVWQGVVQKRAFNTFSLEVSKSEAMARSIFAGRKVGQYWDICAAVKEDPETSKTLNAINP